jgi:3-deoxy-D-arabino-heptulosonate 7-phosphate (DAHP) synthase
MNRPVVLTPQHPGDRTALVAALARLALAVASRQVAVKQKGVA